MTVGTDHTIRSLGELDAIYGEPVPAAVIKEIDHISDHYRAFIEVSPFVVLATVGPEGLDCSPRGDPAGFVRVVDAHTVLIPDRRGNNRVDSLRNIVRDPRVALLFLIPGIGQTLRVNGRASLSTDPGLRASFAVGERGEKVPACVIVVTAETVYTQCPKALVRSKLWDPSTQVPRSELPSPGEMLQAIAGADFDGKVYDEQYPKRIEETIY
jgi:PPOX class probable FMN-dependent enzyme